MKNEKLKTVAKNLKPLVFALSFLVLISVALIALAHQVGNQNINSRDIVGEQWTWNDVIGWQDWHHSDIHNIAAGADELRGWASSSIGVVVFNCETIPNGNICGDYTQPFKVNQDPPASGDLAGWGWNENFGWVSFCGTTGVASFWNGSRWTCPANPDYQVKIRKDGTNLWSYFDGWAWNNIIGWVSFNCTNDGSCGTSDYKVQTSAGGDAQTATIDSSIFDTGSDKAVFNTFIWKGALNGGVVKFEVATSNSATGPWIYNLITPTPAAGNPAKLIGAPYLNRRYFRYRVTLNTDVWQAASPRIDDIIINWSP